MPAVWFDSNALEMTTAENSFAWQVFWVAYMPVHLLQFWRTEIYFEEPTLSFNYYKYDVSNLSWNCMIQVLQELKPEPASLKIKRTESQAESIQNRYVSVNNFFHVFLTFPTITMPCHNIGSQTSSFHRTNGYLYDDA